jgi:threonine dehydratase
MPLSAPLVKVTSTRSTGARVILHGRNFDESYEHAEKLSVEEKLQFVSPFDDERIIAGQSSCGQEIADQLPDADYVVVPVGGGGLVSGIGLALNHRSIKAKIIGVQSEWVVTGRAGEHATPLITPVTIADGIAVKRIGKITGPLVAALTDKLVTVTEEQVAESIIRLLEHERTVIEGAGAAALAAVLGGCIPDHGKKVVVLACGSNIDMNVLSRLIKRDMGLHQRLLKVSVSVPDRPGSLAAITRLLAEKNANVLEVLHNRAFAAIPGNVEIEFLLEVREHKHSTEILNALKAVGLSFTV